MPCTPGTKYFGLHPFPSDLLIDDLQTESYLAYDAIVLLPNGGGQQTNLENARFLENLKLAIDSGVVVAGWCRSVRLLAAADALEGRQIVGHADYAEDYSTAGAEYLGNDHEPVIDGNIITVVRSRLYRTDGCTAIRDAIVRSRASQK